MTGGGRASRFRALAPILALLLLWPTWVAAKNGLSGLYARPAIDYLQDKRVEDYAVTQAEWQAIQDSVMQAAQLMPDNPQYLAALGWLEQLKLTLFADNPGTQPIDRHSQVATRHFRRALNNRPTYSAYWGNLALEHYRAERFDAPRFSAALTNAARFGPWKNDTQRLVTDLGVEKFAALTPRARQEVLLNIERGLHRQPQIILEMVATLGGWPPLCAMHQEQPGIGRPHLDALCLQLRQRGSAST